MHVNSLHVSSFQFYTESRIETSRIALCLSVRTVRDKKKNTNPDGTNRSTVRDEEHHVRTAFQV